MYGFSIPGLGSDGKRESIIKFGGAKLQVTPCHRQTVVATVDLTRRKSVRFDGGFSTLLRRAPRPVVMARQELNQEFAVLLMRSGYTAVDELDFVGMQEFQAMFFEIRSREWEEFIKHNFGMRQGKISDARYFDFISYAQMLTIQYFMREPQVLFEESYSDSEGMLQKRLVKRDVDKYGTPESLLDGWRRLTGEKIYERMLETVKRPVGVMGADYGTVMKGIKDIYEYLLLGGFCLDVVFTEMTGKTGPGVGVEMVGPCILWSCDALRRLRSIGNDYDCFCVERFCERCGVRVTHQTKLSENSIVREWRMVDL